MTEWLPMSEAKRDDAPILLCLGQTIPDSPDIRCGNYIGPDACRELGEEVGYSDGGWLIWNSGSDWFVVEVDEPVGWAPTPIFTEQSVKRMLLLRT